jgi:CheY-like chemotaxis protein
MDSDAAQSARTLRSHDKETQLQSWEDEGGKAALSTEPVRILIVDNDMGAADSLEHMLHESGYSETQVAYSGHAALAIAAEFQPDVVLLDLGLLDWSGYELARSLRGQAQSRSLRLIALTSSREHTAREQARAAGFERYLLKPVAALDLCALVETSFE